MRTRIVAMEATRPSAVSHNWMFLSLLGSGCHNNRIYPWFFPAFIWCWLLFIPYLSPYVYAIVYDSLHSTVPSTHFPESSVMPCLNWYAIEHKYLRKHTRTHPKRKHLSLLCLPWCCCCHFHIPFTPTFYTLCLFAGNFYCNGDGFSPCLVFCGLNISSSHPTNAS